MNNPLRSLGGAILRDPGPTESPRRLDGWTVLRLLVSAYFVVDLVDTVLNPDGSLSVSMIVMHALATAACVVLCWRPMLGGVLGLLTLALNTIHPWRGGELNLYFMLPIVLLPLLSPAACVVLGGVLVLQIVTFVARNSPPGDGGYDLASRFIMLAASTIVALALRVIMDQRREGQARIHELELENAKIRADERASLARELHDVVAHQLSIISLQIMGHRDSEDPEELRAALDRVDEASGAALGELQLLLEVLRDDDETDTSFDRLAEISAPTTVAGHLAETLADNGFHPRMQVGEQADRLELSEQLTVSRVLQEAGTNILRHAPAGAWCSFQVAVGEHEVELEVRSPLARQGESGQLGRLSLGYGLRGIAERVDLTGGTLSAGPSGGDWVIRMSLPRVSARRGTSVAGDGESGASQTPLALRSILTFGQSSQDPCVTRKSSDYG